MRAILLTLSLLLALTNWGIAQVVLENFEGGAQLPWNAANGAFDVVDNPPDQDTLMINPSAEVGSYTKEEGAAFSLLIAELDDPLDLSTNNQFRIMVNAPVATAFILKLEGDGEAIEETKNIAVANQWIEYTFNFSEAGDFTTLNKIILFFDPGTAESSDTYLFDNLVTEPNPCEGVMADPGILDDFECQRNVQYGLPGLTDIEAVDNPDPSGINTSTRVGEYTDRQGAFHAMVIPFRNDIPLGDRNVVRIKIWAPVTGRLLVKLEGGDSAPIEKDAQVEETNTWVEYSIDFSDQANASHRQLVFFFNAGEADADGDIYYIDDIQLAEKEVVSNVLEDFEDGASLTWLSLGDEAVFGTFDGVIENPDKTAPNTSDNVGSYTKGTSQFGGLQADLPLDFDLGSAPQLNLQVWAPANASSLEMRLFSPSQGLQSVSRDIDAVNTWIDLNFDFSEFAMINDFERVEIVFDPDLNTQDTWYFDNLSQGEATGDPCEGVEPDPNVIDDFDCQRNIAPTTGADRLEVILNPDPSGINGNASDMVGQYTDPIDLFSALVYDFGGPIDLSLFNQLTIKIWSPKAVPLGFKLEGGTSDPVELTTDVTETEQWVEYIVDFSDQADANHTRLALFFNFGQEPTEEDVYFIDDIEWRRAPIMGCVSNFETPEFTLDEWQYFANGDLSNEIVDVVVDNPDPSGINTSATVGEFIERPGGENFAGMFHVSENEFSLPNDNKTMRMKVWMDNPGRVVLKLERSTNDAPNTGDVFSETDYTGEGEWQELTFDYSGIVPDDALYTTVTVIMDFDDIPDEEKVYYFDDIVIGNADCAVTTSRSRVELERLQVSPNPAYNRLIIQNAEGLERFVIYNMLGQPVQTIRTTGQYGMEIDLAEIGKGVYILNGYDRTGALRATTKFVKH